MISVRRARSEEDFQKIHRLNYETFVEEIPQHGTNSTKILVDQFHHENTYFIAELNGQLLGMCALRDKRPFSLDKKIPNIDKLLPPFKKPLEVRLLSVKKEYRNTAIASAIFKEIAKYTLNNGYDIILISGTTRQLEMYAKLGFKAFHPAVGKEAAQYVPMFLTGFDLVEQLLSRSVITDAVSSDTFNFLPGPVHMSDGVKQALLEEPISHRSPAGVNLLQATRTKLCKFTNSNRVVLVPGSGTLGNEIIAEQLVGIEGKGLILINGEFGQRLTRIASSINLTFDTLDVGWGRPFSSPSVEEALQTKRYSWIWMVVHETSTGMLNDYESVKLLANKNGCLLALDAVSALGAIDLNLSDVAFTSATSGKALGAPAGFALIFYDPKEVRSVTDSHRYLSLAHWHESESMPYTFSTPILRATAIGLNESTPERMDRIKLKTELVHSYLENMGFSCVTPLEFACPGIVTVEVLKSSEYLSLMRFLEELNIWVNWRGGYLEDRRLFQVSLFGDPPLENILFLLKSLKEFRKKLGTNVAIQTASSVMSF